MSTAGLSWMEQARCKGADTDIFFAEMPRGRNNPKRKEAIEAVTRPYCKQCPVLEQCLTWALAKPEPFGIWGGMSAEEREELQAAQRRIS